MSLVGAKYLFLTFLEANTKKCLNLFAKEYKSLITCDPTVSTRGEFCKKMKLSIFRDELQLPDFMDNLHYRDANYGEKFGLKVLGHHRVLIHLHICHDIFRILVGPLSKSPYSMYEYYRQNNIAFISENAKTAQMFEFICGYITMTRKSTRDRTGLWNTHTDTSCAHY
uniref:Uncharacterized protein n=1 Tax=Romanomermis culicivorax TaxID=13658 RepID=A0A915KPS5_ROMCU